MSFNFFFGGGVPSNIFKSAALDLNFAKNKSLVDSKTGQNLITFTRASGATFVGSNGLIQSSVFNLLVRSEEFNTAWTPLGTSITPNAAASPSGATTADLMTETSTTGYHEIYVNSNASAGTYTFSIFVKNNSGTRHLNLTFSNGQTNAISLRVNAVTGSLSSIYTEGSTFSAATSTVTSYANGWYRVSVSFATSSSFFCGIGLSTSSGAPPANNYGLESYAGDGTSGIYIWGAQLELGATAGEYVQTTSAANGAPRFDHNPMTLESLGLLIEEARSNLLVRSEEFDNTSWNKYSAGGPVAPVVTSNQSAAPNGGIVADKIVLPAVSGVGARCIVYQAPASLPAATKFSISCYLKGDVGGEKVWVGQTDNSTWSSVQCNLTTSWQRFSFSFTTSVAGIYYITIGVDLLDGSQTATAAQTFYAWGAQIEAGAFPTSYIPTTGATVTRAADSAIITGTNFSSWYSQSQGTVYGVATMNGIAPQNYIAEIDAGAGYANSHLCYAVSGTPRFETFVTNSLQSQLIPAPANALTAGSQFALAYAFKQDDFAAARNGGSVATDVSGNMPTVNRLCIGSNGSTTMLNGTIKRLAYWPKRLSDPILQKLTR